jgi:hypothetical protein
MSAGQDDEKAVLHRSHIRQRDRKPDSARPDSLAVASDDSCHPLAMTPAP